MLQTKIMTTNDEAEITRLNKALMEAIVALNLIAAPKRPDGTYNRCREACEQVARDALDKIMEL